MDRNTPVMTPSRQAAVMAVALAMSPLWMAVNPGFWLSRNTKDYVPTILCTVAGAAAVGAVFLLIARLRGKAPSIAFAAAVPGIGVFGYALLSWPLMPFYHSYFDVVSIGYTGLLWAYLFGCFVTGPLAVVHAFLMGWVARPRPRS